MIKAKVINTVRKENRHKIGQVVDVIGFVRSNTELYTGHIKNDSGFRIVYKDGQARYADVGCLQGLTNEDHNAMLLMAGNVLRG